MVTRKEIIGNSLKGIVAAAISPIFTCHDTHIPALPSVKSPSGKDLHIEVGQILYRLKWEDSWKDSSSTNFADAHGEGRFQAYGSDHSG